ncbi:hypothetical protein vseg_004874 [Gypsophila vaccaria]
MESKPVSYSYPDSSDSSPRFRDLDFGTAPPPSWEDHQPPSYKLKFMVSYGGKIQPRSHDNLLAYVGGDTKILALDTSVKFSSMHAKLATLFNPLTSANSLVTGFTVKYQLPGEDLDALISVTNDDDLEYMMHEYDRVLRGSVKTNSARLRLFLFNDDRGRNNLHQQWPDNHHSGASVFSSAESETGKLGGESDPEPDRADNKFLDSVSSNQHQRQRQQNDVVLDRPPRRVSPPVQLPAHSKVDFLFGLDKGPVQGHHVQEAGRFQNPVQELNQFQLREQQQQQQQQQSAMYYPRNDENNQATPQMPAGYWQQVEHHHSQQQPQMQQHQQQYHPQQQHQQLQQQQQPMYMMHAPPQGSMYHAPMTRGPSQPNQGYYQPLYSTLAAAAPPMSVAAQVRPVMAGESTGYQQAGAGRQGHYTMALQGGGPMALPYPGMKVAAVAVSDCLGDGKGLHKNVSSPKQI